MIFENIGVKVKHIVVKSNQVQSESTFLKK